MNPKNRTIVFYERHFENFFNRQRQKVKDKIIWTFDLIEQLETIPETYLKHIADTDGLYEIRVQQASDIFRIFSFLDEGKIVVLLNGFETKTQKTPKDEITKAKALKAAYYAGKK